MIKERHKNGYLKNRDVKLVNRYTEFKSTKTDDMQSYNFGELISKRKNKGFLWATTVVPTDVVVSGTHVDNSQGIEEMVC